MLRTLQVSRSGMAAQQRRVEITANNLANVATTGFRRVLLAQQTGRVNGANPQQLALPIDVQTQVDLSQGAMEKTGNELHAAINGDGFFVLQTPDGDRFTRDGAFRLDPDGNLVSGTGIPIAGDGGPLLIPAGDVEIATDGRVLVDGQEVGSIRVVRFDDPSSLRPAGHGMLSAEPNVEPVDIEPNQRQLVIGHLEGSNANPVTELVNLITAQRVFESNQRVLTTTDDSLRKTVNDIPKLG